MSQNTPKQEDGIAISASITRIDDHWEIRVTLPFWIHQNIHFDAFIKRSVEIYIHNKRSHRAEAITETIGRTWMVSELTNE